MVQEIFTKKDAFEFLKNIHSAVIATVSPKGEPHATTIYYAVDEELHLYFLTRSETKKSLNIENNHKVAMVVSDQKSLRTMQISGIALKITDVDKFRQIIKLLSTTSPIGMTFSWPSPLTKLQEGEIIAFQIVPSVMRFGDFSHSHGEFAGDFLWQIVL